MDGSRQRSGQRRFTGWAGGLAAWSVAGLPGAERGRLDRSLAVYDRRTGKSLRAIMGVGALWTSGLAWVAEAPTLAEGIRVRLPVRGDAVLQAVAQSGGSFLAVDEEEIMPARDALARLGMYVEPTSAVVWGALAQVSRELPDPIVAVLTGSGFKASDRV